MIFGDFFSGMICLAQNAVGILGNFSVLYYQTFFYDSKHKFRSTDLILRHLMMANCLLLLSTGVPHMMTAFGFKHLFLDFACRLALYVHRVGRSVSMSSICLLSVFQATTISPMSSRWQGLKVRATKHLRFFIYLCWVLYLVISLVFSFFYSNTRNSKNMTKKTYLGLCSVDHDPVASLLYMAFIVFPEVVFSVLIIWSSGSMMFILYRHKQQVQHLHGSWHSPGSSREIRATQSILALVCTFASSYTLSSILNAYQSISDDCSWWLGSINELNAGFFPTVSPFIFMSRDPHVSRFCFHCVRNTKLRIRKP